MNITIEKGIEIPNQKWARIKRKPKYPFQEMEMGDSFFVKNDAARASAHNFAKENKVAFTSRKVDGGYRIWRIK